MAKEKRVNKNLDVDDKDYHKPGQQFFLKGNPGRPKGAKAEFTCLKDSFINAFKRMGGEEALLDWLYPETIEVKDKKGKVLRVIDFSPERKKEFFKMITKMLPADIQLSEVPKDKASLIEAIQGMKPDDIKDLIKAISSS